MAELTVRVIYDSFLRRKVKPVTVFDASLKREADQMLKIMKLHNGLGLAANQVGLDKQLIVLGYEPTGDSDELPRIPTLQLTNLKILKQSREKEIMTEGCLSLPGLELPVERSAGVVVEAQDLKGQKTQLRAKGLLARILQHEIDHLNGVLFTDRAKNYKNLDDYRFARIVFIGSDDFSRVILDSLCENQLSIIAVVTETAKRAGRGQQVVEPALKALAEKLEIAVFQPEDKDEVTSVLEQLQPDLVVLASYGKILPAGALAAPAYGSLNVHPSLLPKYRGATPIQTAILNGDKTTGVTIMSMVPEVDAGDVIAQTTVPIVDETAPQLRQKLARAGAELLLKTLSAYLAGQAKPLPQDRSQASLTKKLAKEDGLINWQEPIETVNRRVRALQPWPGSYTLLGDKRLKVLESSVIEGKLRLAKVQLEGKNPTSWADFKRGHEKELTKTTWYAKIY